MLNFIWAAFFVSAFITALFKLVILGDRQIFGALTAALFASSKSAFDIALGLTGVLTLWLGIMRIAEASGFVQLLTRALTPLFSRLLPEVPAGHPALGAMVMNIAANALGLDNAATPLGIRAMQHLQSLNPKPDTASDAQILFLVVNTSGVTLLPVAIFTYRAQLGALQPTDVFIPILIATYASTLTGLLAVAAAQKIKLRDGIVLLYLGGLTLAVSALVYYFSTLTQAQMLQQSAFISNALLFSLIMAFIGGALRKRVNVYQTFIEGAEQGFQSAIAIVPYLVAMLIALGVFRASGALDLIAAAVKSGVRLLQLDDRFVEALPTALMKPFSGSGARAMMIDTMKTAGADSFAGRLACIVQGSTETTFYVLAVYFGAVNIKHVRHAAICGIIADLGGISAAVAVAYWFFG